MYSQYLPGGGLEVLGVVAEYIGPLPILKLLDGLVGLTHLIGLGEVVRDLEGDLR